MVEYTGMLMAAIIGGLVTYFISSITSGNRISLSLEKEMTRHEKELHKDNFFNVIKGSVKEHAETCDAPRELRAIKTALVFLVTKAGGNPADLGL